MDPRNAERVALHLVAAGTLVDEDAAQALAHARAARDRASRVAVVREAVGVAAYHAGDFAEAGRELRAYRRMTGDETYRAVLADCERALGRPDVALRLVHEALAEHPDAEETAELRLVEAGARQDLGETAAARLVLESALGGRPRPDQLSGADAGTLRLAAGYAELLRDEGHDDAAEQWFAALALADTENVTGAGVEPDVEFGEEEFDDDHADALGADVPEVDAEQEDDGAEDRLDAVVAGHLDRDLDFAAQVEAEVAELLGETGDEEQSEQPPAGH